MTILYLISRVHLSSFVILQPKQLKYSTFSSCFSSLFTCTGDVWLYTLNTSVFFPTFISIPQHLPISIILSAMPCSTVSFLASNTSSSFIHRQETDSNKACFSDIPVMLIKSGKGIVAYRLRVLPLRAVLLLVTGSEATIIRAVKKCL